MTFLLDLVQEAADRIQLDFDTANVLRPFWENYKPRQRGRSYKGDSVPWIEVAEKTVSFNFLRVLNSKNLNQLDYPGLPLDGDLRFALEEVLIHLDVKATGPNDNHNEIVASPFQISGDGR